MKPTAKQVLSYFRIEHVHGINFTLSKQKWYFNFMRNVPSLSLHVRKKDSYCSKMSDKG